MIDADIAVITNVSIDHVQYLGTTAEQIAAEKAGIVKKGSMLVLGETDPDLVPFFTDRDPARVLQRDVDFGVRAQRARPSAAASLELYTSGARYPDVFVPLHGAHQGDNAAIALAAAEAFVGAPLEPEAVYDAFARVRSPGRLEIVGRHPLVLLDGAHNVAGAEALRDALAEEFAPGAAHARGRPAARAGTARDADGARTRRRRAARVRPAAEPRALDPAVIAEAAVELGFPADAHRGGRHAGRGDVERAARRTPEDGEIVVTGSLYFVGAARGMLVDLEMADEPLEARFGRVWASPVACCPHGRGTHARPLQAAMPSSAGSSVRSSAGSSARASRSSRSSCALLDADTAKQHYAEHDGKPFFDDLVSFITRSPLVAMVVEGPDAWKVMRTMMGATNPREAAPGTIRGDLAIELTENLVHGSDGSESAAREIALFFPGLP